MRKRNASLRFNNLALFAFIAHMTLAGHISLANSSPSCNRTRSELFGNKQMANYLNQFPTITIDVVDAPGNGHQAINLTLITRIISAGYSGKIYVYSESKEALDKVRNMMVPEDRTNVEFLAVGQFHRPDLVLAGASTPTSWDADGLVFFPYSWSQSYWFKKGKKINRELSETRVFRLDIPDPADPSSWLGKAGREADDFSKKLPTLQFLAQNLSSLELLPWYSGHENGADVVLNNLTTSISRLVRSGKLKDINGPIVILSFSTFLPVVPAGIRVIDASSPGAIAGLSTANKGEIILLKVGFAPQEIFNYFFSKSTFPPGVEGKNGINLLINLGYPFFSIREDFPFLDQSWGKETIQLIKNANLELATGANAARDELDHFILGFRDGNSDLSAAYRNYSERALAVDKIEDLILWARDSGMSPPSPEQSMENAKLNEQAKRELGAKNQEPNSESQQMQWWW